MNYKDLCWKFDWLPRSINEFEDWAKYSEGTRKLVTAILWWQLWSEGKWKVISYLAKEFNVAIRWWSPNAWHTVFDEEYREYKLRQIPATFLNEDCLLMINSWALIDEEVLRKEVEDTKTKTRLIISPKAWIIEKRHIEAEQGSWIVGRIWSTGKGCWAALIDRIWRNPEFKFAKDVFDDFLLYDASLIANHAMNYWLQVLLEWTQWCWLDMIHWPSPYTTSRSTSAAELCAESGIPAQSLDTVCMVIRTYPIRVAWNSWPLPNEITWEQLSRKIWKDVEERTTVTNKVRRVWEFDPEQVKKAILSQDPHYLALNFLDYKFPEDEWVNNFQSLSYEAKRYIFDLENELWKPILFIWTWKENSAMIDRR